LAELRSGRGQEGKAGGKRQRAGGRRERQKAEGRRERQKVKGRGQEVEGKKGKGGYLVVAADRSVLTHRATAIAISSGAG
jgi:hypothetical protein